MENTNHDTIRDNIQWLAFQKALGKISEEEDQSLTQQIQSNPEARAAYEEAMEQFESSDAQQYLISEKYLTYPDWDKIQEDLRSRKLKIRRIYTLLSAACVVGIAATLFFVFLRPKPSMPPADQILLSTVTGDHIILNNAGTIKTNGAVLTSSDSALTFTTTDENASGINTLTVPSGLDYKLRLDDGTLVWLNSESKIHFPFKFGKRREITIEGEAYLEVTQNANRPFIVHLPGGEQIRVLGTSFNVNAYDKNVSKIALVSGSVAVNTGSDSTLLTPGNLAQVNARTISTAPFDQNSVLSWREGIFLINSEKMSDVASVISRWYGKKVIIDNPELSEKVFSGRLNRRDSVTTFLDKAKMVVDFSYSFDQQGVLHLK